MKKSIALLLAVLFSVTLLVGCGGEKGNVADNPTSNTASDSGTAGELVQPEGGDGQTNLTYEQLKEKQSNFLKTVGTKVAEETYTYEMVAKFVGIEGKNVPTTLKNLWKFEWYATDGGSMYVMFNSETGLYYSWTAEAP